MPGILLLKLGVLALSTGVVMASCAPAATPPDPVKISPQYYTVLLDTNHVRVLEYRLASGQKEAMHAHPNYVVYFFQEAKLRVTYPDGHSSETVVTPGETLYRDPLSHALENIGDTEVHALLVELQSGSR
jgi:quercetin dioxygenase-like cupin family protein